MIARQRIVLNRTFVHEQDAPAADEVVRRLLKSEEELAEATERFADGIAQRGEPIPALAEAVAAMNLAKASLAGKQLAAARPHEETALAALVSARRNLRKMLGQSNSQQASACRSFDRQQEQNLRRPPQDHKKQELAKLENDLRKLAKEERAFSEELEPRSRPGKPQESVSAPSPGGPAQRQQEAVKEAERLRDLAREDESLTGRTRQRLGDVTETIHKSAEEIQAKRPVESVADARTAAEQLERLAQQVGALKAGELADQMARTRDLARSLSRDQGKLEQALRAGRPDAGDKNNGSWARRERELAEEASGVGDLMDRLRDEAAAVDPQLARTLTEAGRSNPAREIEQAMQQSARDAEAGQPSAATQNAQDATHKLDELARDLESARRRLVQPQLDRYRAQEKMAAKVQEQINSVKDGGQQAQAERVLSELARSLDGLASSQDTLREAVDRLNRALAPGANRTWRKDDAQASQGTGFFIPPSDTTDSLHQVLLALQSKIQQLVLDQALMERDQSVPPRYKSLVEDYYRVLSQDLR